MSTNFVKIYEIGSNVPILSSDSPPKDKVPFNLTLKVYKDNVTLFKGLPEKKLKSFSRLPSGKFDIESLHSYLIDLKKNHPNENTIVLEPLFDVNYEEIVLIMDSVRNLRKTDPSIYVKDRKGIETKIIVLFNDIIFGNIQS